MIDPLDEQVKQQMADPHRNPESALHMAAQRKWLNSSVWAVAIALTLLGALKPITVDEAVYYQYARQIAEHPADPYGFEIFWGDKPVEAMQVVAPVGFSYWLAAGISLLGDQPWLWKLWLFPYALLLAGAVQQLLARYAPGGEIPLLWMMILSPSIVPAFNLMLDVPSLALGVGAIALFMLACERDRVSFAVLAGVLCALALQTKYTAFAQLAALAIYGVLNRKWLMLFSSLSVAVGLFAAWEGWLVYRYGVSHFITSLQYPPNPGWANTVLGWSVGWLALAGALATPIALLALGAHRLEARWRVGVICLAASPYLMVAMLEAPRDAIAFAPTQLGVNDTALEIFFLSGVVVVVLVFRSIIAWYRRLQSRPPLMSIFILCWFAIELIACFSISPFHALRRYCGPVLVGTLVVAHVAMPGDAGGKGLRWVAVFGVALAVIFGVADILDNRARLRIQDAIASELDSLGYDPDQENVWFTGHWGFEFYSERRGYSPLIARRSQIKKGDWLVFSNSTSAQGVPRISRSGVLAEVSVSSVFPLATMPNSYQAAVAIRRQPRFQNRVAIMRVLESGFIRSSRRGRPTDLRDLRDPE